MDIDEYVDGMPILLLDGKEAAQHVGGFKGGWNNAMDKWIGQEVIPQRIIRNPEGRIEEFWVHDDERDDGKDHWHWDHRFVEVVDHSERVSEEDFDAVLN